MSEATNRVVELRAQLAQAELIAQKELIAKGAKKTKAYRKNHYSVTTGPNENYIGISPSHGDCIELEITEFTFPEASITLDQDELVALIAGLQAHVV